MRETGFQTNESLLRDKAPECYAAGREFSPTEKIEELFSYHSPSPEQVPKYEAIRAAAKYFAGIIVSNTPRGSDQSAAIRLLRESVMTANAGIANNGLNF